jgi:hypothetical protein
VVKLKSRERTIITRDDKVVFLTVRMGNGEIGIRATGFDSSGGGGNVFFGDVKI